MSMYRTGVCNLENNLYISEEERPTRTFQTNGCCVTATFQPTGKGVDLGYVTSLLESSFVKKFDAEKPK